MTGKREPAPETAAAERSPDLQLIRHWGVKEGSGHQVEDGHPPLPSGAVRVLRKHLCDIVHRDLMWWHRNGHGDVWAAVIDLHQSGDHDTAVALAQFLHWCDAWPRDDVYASTPHADKGARLWELRPVATS